MKYSNDSNRERSQKYQNKKTCILERQSFAIKLSHNEETKEIDQAQGYKYLGVIEVNEIKDRMVTEKLGK